MFQLDEEKIGYFLVDNTCNWFGHEDFYGVAERFLFLLAKMRTTQYTGEFQWMLLLKKTSLTKFGKIEKNHLIPNNSGANFSHPIC